ncbi:MAG: PrgI family protein [Ruminococcus sp.]|uniref:PrgI family mobile element protein n=1 Tax=Ruminococcus sp. TaxID=41978 RepID=UPI001AFD2940|nr:PrgI family protein [Ruminococcus sp.]MBO7475148.1 PrgI family protein [Ruminococcus sp.]
MIKAKITKNIMQKTNNSLGLTPKQMITGGIAFAIGILMYVLLRKYMSFILLSTIIFIFLALVIGFGVINIQGMNLMQFVIKTLKGADVRYYKQEGVYMNDIQKEK